ncbi:carboxypeptidase-like protein [Winogradskyella wandonensis]|uniref:Carboxypeptidase-like protein n=1 Tax=Winogradskyella wandonensis TaxID=1442586 RepID=A0A4V2PTP9_9FLAO|nr:Imm42 family immunity protein [Winogradskyella wandonensis]TCK67331.1 carboxypeptidase-like protein [Winogradskyella wandonensis]
MKKTLQLILLFLSLSASAQLIRVEIKGQIIVEGDDLEGITIFNKTSGQGTISDAQGNFSINIKVGDVLQVRALQYQDFNIVINEAMIASRRLNVFLIQEINQLDEIVLSNKKVTGNLVTDLEAVPTFTPKMDAIYFAVKQEPQLNESRSEFIRNNINLTNATSQNKPLVNGLNLVNVVDQLLLPLFRSEVEDKDKVGVPEVPVEAIKYYFGSEFLSDNFGIPKHRVEEFIRYVERKDFDFSLLNYGRELEFLELLNKKSIEFLEKESTDKD